MAKLKITEEVRNRALANFIAFSGAICIYFLIINSGNIFGAFRSFIGMLSPFIYGFVIAYLLKSPMMYIEKKYIKILSKNSGNRDRKKLIRGLSLTTTLTMALILLVGFISIIVPQLIDSISIFIDHMPTYMNEADIFLNKLTDSISFDSEIVKNIVSMWQTLLSKTSEIISTLLPSVIDGLLTFSGKILNLAVGIVVAIYFLAGKEKFVAQIKKVTAALFPDKATSYIMEKSKMTNRIFSKYISGQLTDAAVLGIICFISMSLFKMPYALLVSMIITVTNVIPIIGPFIGALPSLFIISMVSPSKALGFAVLILVLQQIDGNILVPKIVGDSTGLSGFWVFLAIFIGGGLFGISGVILGVPTMAVSYNIIKEIVESRLSARNKPVETSEYM